MTDASDTRSLRGTFQEIGSLAAREAQWRALEAQADCSFFVSWSWIGPWLRLIRGHVSLLVYECHEGDDLIALAVIARHTVRRRKVFESRTISLNELRRSGFDMCIEYNGMLARKGQERRALQQLVTDAVRALGDWDELQLTNVRDDELQGLSLEHLGVQLVRDLDHSTWIAPLDRQTTLESLFARMSSNRRSKIRRAFKEYEKQGALTIDEAPSVEKALEYFKAMGVLHTQRWNRVGLAGSFANPNWVAFHEDLIAAAFSRGEVQLLRIRCGAREIGFIYNFVWRNAVLMLQSGFASESSNLLRPGYVSHLLAMQLNGQMGRTQYDFLLGDSEYKNVLAEPIVRLVSGRMQRRRIKFLVENGMVGLYRRICPSR